MWSLNAFCLKAVNNNSQFGLADFCFVEWLKSFENVASEFNNA